MHVYMIACIIVLTGAEAKARNKMAAVCKAERYTEQEERSNGLG